MRSHTQASPPSWAAIIDSNRNLAGSAIAFNVRARSVAAAALSGSRTNGTQQEVSASGRVAERGMNPSMPDVLTDVDVRMTMNETLMFVYERGGDDQF